MLWSLVKVVLFLALVGALAVLGGVLSDSGHEIRISLAGWEFTLDPLPAVVLLLLAILAIWLLLKLLGFIMATIHFLNGDETAISRYFDRNRERRGYAALSEGLIALASGEHAVAMQRARTAERLLKKPELTTLLLAQAAEGAGDKQAAQTAYKSLLQSETTRFVGVRGLMRQKLGEGDTETALKLAEKAFALKPRHGETQDILLKLQAEHADWRGARATLSEKHRSGDLPRSVYRRRDALLALQEAKAITDDAGSIEAREAAIEANRLSPDLIPAAVIAARALIEKGDKKSATRVLKKAWEAQPHPDLAAVFAEMEPDETPQMRLKRFKTLLAIRPQDEETRLMQAELMLAAEDFAGAKTALGSIAADHPTQRALAILAAAERGTGASDQVVREILTRALSASRGPQWCCDKCEAVQSDWHPICASCGGFDTLSWREPAKSRQDQQARGVDLAPLIFAEDRHLPEAAEQPEDTPVEAEALPNPDDILRRAN